MDTAQTESYRQKLLDKRKELMDRVRAIRTAEVKSSGKAAADFVDRASDARSREILYRLTATERLLLQAIDAALYRIVAGDYGSCSHCQKPIQEARLQAVPWALHCIECQELQDNGKI